MTYTEMLLSVVGVLIALSQVAIAFLTYRRDALDSQWKIWEMECSEEQTNYRDIVDKIPEDFDIQNLTSEEEKAIKLLSNHYQNVGSLVFERHLSRRRLIKMPMGESIVKYFDILHRFIKYKRETYNPRYANKWEWLYDKIQPKIEKLKEERNNIKIILKEEVK